jgi:O-glycosyl hydrolase
MPSDSRTMPFCSLVIGFLICGCVLHASAQDDRATQVHVEPSREVGRFHGMGCGAIFYEAHITSLSKRGHHAAQKALYDDMFTKVNTRFLQLMIRHDHEPKNDNADPWKPEFKDEWFAYALETLAICRAALERQPTMEFHATLYTPPVWMKTNNDITAGGESRATLKEGMNLELAEFCWAFVDFMRRNGVRVHHLSIANEPDWPHTQPGYCLNPEQNAILTATVGDYLEEMQRRHPETSAPKIVGPNTLSAVGAANDYLPPLISKAGRHLHIIGSHDYDRRGERWKNLVAKAEGRPVWCSEWCVNGHDDSAGLIRSMTEYWLAMSEAFNQGVNAWMAYDWVYPPRPGGEALIHVDWGSSYEPTKIYHGFRQWCEPLSPGMKTVATRLEGSAATGTGQPGVKACAFLSEDGRRLVLHLANVQDIPASLSIHVPEPWSKFPARRFITSSEHDMKKSERGAALASREEMPNRSVLSLIWDVPAK